MGPTDGTPAYVAQVDEVLKTFRFADPRGAAEEDQVIVMFALDQSYSRNAIMEALGKFKQEKRGDS